MMQNRRYVLIIAYVAIMALVACLMSCKTMKAAVESTASIENIDSISNAHGTIAERVAESHDIETNKHDTTIIHERYEYDSVGRITAITTNVVRHQKQQRNYKADKNSTTTTQNDVKSTIKTTKEEQKTNIVTGKKNSGKTVFIVLGIVIVILVLGFVCYKFKIWNYLRTFISTAKSVLRKSIKRF